MDPNQPGGVPGASPGVDPMYDASAQSWERTYATIMHATPLVPIPTPIVPVLVMWLIKKDQSAFINDHGKEALNFQLSLLIYAVGGAILTPVLGLGVLVLLGTVVLMLVGSILGLIAASQGRYFRYPMCLRLVK